MKTLKDLKSPMTLKKFHMPTYACYRRAIREEAIKWVKKFKWDINNPESKKNEYADRRTFAFIVHFFNITEEDLE